MKKFSELQNTQPKKGLEIDLLAVGGDKSSGDAILLRYGNLEEGNEKQYVIIIDGGYCGTANDIKECLKDYYNCYNVNGKYIIDLVILSHTDNDHVCGLVELAKDEEIEIENILMRKPWEELDPSYFKDGRITEGSLERRLMDVFNKAAELAEIAETNDVHFMDPTTRTFEFGGAEITILGPSDKLYCEMIAASEKTPDAIACEAKRQTFSAIPDEEDFEEGDEIKWNYDETTSAINETSIIILFEYDGQKILFTGDAGKRGLEEAIAYAEDHKIDLSNLNVIKMPHHGSRKNVYPELMDRLKGPTTRCYISCAQDDEGHHPSKRLVNMLTQKGFKVFFTKGSNLLRSHNAPDREKYKSVDPHSYYPTMEKL